MVSSLCIFEFLIVRLMKKLNLVLLSLLISAVTIASTVTKTYYIPTPDVINNNDYQSIIFNNSLSTGIVGEPTLPYFAISLLIPPGEVATSISIVALPEDLISLEGDIKLFPYQSSIPLSASKRPDFQINEKLYNSSKIYPQNLTGNLNTRYLSGYSIAMSTFTPIKYYPSQKKAAYYSKVTITIKTEPNIKSVNALNSLSSSVIAKKRLLNIIQNPKAASAYKPNKTKSANSYKLLIITPDEFVDGFSDLTNIYLSRGITSEIFSTEYISTNISGQDLQEKIRNFIIQEYQESNIEYVILGGDVEHIPYRGFYCYVESGGGYTSYDIPADLYYSALDGTWDDNGNGIWGEPDEDDLLPEVAVARYPFSYDYELARIIHKSINYQNSPVLGELVTPLLAGEHLYSDPETWGRDYLDLLIGEHDDNGYTTIGIPETYQIDSLYEHDANWGGSDIMNEINAGKQFIHHVGHASPSYVAHLNSSDITNANFYGANGIDHNYTLMQTHGCDCGSFDYNDCILEKMVTIDNFAVSVIGNSRFGWFNEGQNEGPAAHLHREMVDALYHEEMIHLGAAFVESKIQTAPWVEAPGQHEEGALRWNFYDINILGDPALSVWTNEPISIEVAFENTLSIGSTSTNVTVTSGGEPLENFTCTILKDGVLHATGETDADGNVLLTFDPVVNSTGEASLFVVGMNCLPDTNTINFIPAGGAYVIYDSHQINDPNGNNNGLADFGEEILLTLAVNNQGVEDATNVVATLSTDDDYVAIIDNSDDYGRVDAGATVTNEDAFMFNVSTDVPDQHLVEFTLMCDSEGETWESGFSIVINAPIPEIGDIIVDDAASGNGNGQLDPGETATIKIVASNTGHSDCELSQMSLNSTDPYITITSTTYDLEEMQAGVTKIAEFNVIVDNATPIGTVISFENELNLCNYIVDKTFAMSVGLLIEDFESGDFSKFEWQMDPTSPWVICNDEPFNGQFCSQSGAINHYESSELLIVIDVISDDVITFSRKVSSEPDYDFLRFYIDGTLVNEWSGDKSWETFSYNISSGQHTLRWAYEKDISATGGSDCSWIDDVIFPTSTTIIGINEFTLKNEFNIYPNPGNGKYNIILDSDEKPTNIVVYGTRGDIVAKPVLKFTSNTTFIDISNLNPGIYFIEVSTDRKKMIRKIIRK